MSIKDKTAIVGIGTTDFSNDSRRTELKLVCEAIKAAVEDAGLKMEDIDGLVKTYADQSDEHHVIRALGIHNLTYHGQIRWGSGGTGALALRTAIGAAAGVANYVVAFRSINGASKNRLEEVYRAMGQVTTEEAMKDSFYAPFGLASTAGYVGMIMRRYISEYRVTADQLASIPVVAREYAARNPRAISRTAITIKDYLSSPIVVDPLRALDIAPPIDGAAAYIVTTVERAKDLKQRPAYIMSAAQGTGTDSELYTSYQRPVLSELPEMRLMAEDLFKVAGISPKDVNVAQLDDAFAPFVPMQLEALGFCGQGEGAAFCEGGRRIRLDGQLPLNTAGGSLGEGNLEGINQVIEAVRQIRGTSTAQVENAKIALAASGAGGPAGGVILRR